MCVWRKHKHGGRGCRRRGKPARHALRATMYMHKQLPCALAVIVSAFPPAYNCVPLPLPEPHSCKPQCPAACLCGSMAGWPCQFSRQMMSDRGKGVQHRCSAAPGTPAVSVAATERATTVWLWHVHAGGAGRPVVVPGKGR
eukprot:356295-Chlamydomonas_euryale.AAC.17